MKLLLFIFAFIPLIAFCQSSDTLKAKGLSIGLVVSPDYCYRILRSDVSNQWITNMRETNEIPKYGFTTGLSIFYKFTKKLSMESGLQYSDKGYKTAFTTLFALQPDPALPKQISYNYSYRYLDLPAKVNYSIVDKRFNLFVSAGLSTNYLLSQKTTIIHEFEDGTKNEKSIDGSIDRLEKINFALVTGLGISYEVSKKIEIRMEPIYRRSLNSIINAPIKGYLHSAGIISGINLKF